MGYRSRYLATIFNGQLAIFDVETQEWVTIWNNLDERYHVVGWRDD